MTTYELVASRFPRYQRSDGVNHLLVPVPRCAICYKPFPQEYEEWGTCYNCKEKSVFDGTIIERVVAASLYIPKVRGFDQNEEIIALKERGEHADVYAEVLAHAMAEERIAPARYRYIVSVPQTKVRPNACGPTALAKELSQRLHVPYAGALTYVRAVDSQKGLSRDNRMRNQRDSMAAPPMVAGADVIVVDDVATTGSTLAEAGRALRAAGVGRALALVAGRDSGIDNLDYIGVVRLADA